MSLPSGTLRPVNDAARSPRNVKAPVVGACLLAIVAVGLIYLGNRDDGPKPSLPLQPSVAYEACRRAITSKGLSAPTRVSDPGVKASVAKNTHTFIVNKKYQCSVSMHSSGKISVAAESLP